VDLSPGEMIRQVATVGACLAGQTGDLAPADKKLYALRDATATVGSLPLIVGSILSKKLAAGASSFLFDVKAGGGALMKTVEEAEALAKALVEGAVQNGRRAVAVLSDMSQPLGSTVGNALEIREAVQALTPGAAVDPRFQQLCLALAAEGLLLAGLARNETDARATAESLIQSGAAREKFRQIVVAQGGDSSFLDDLETGLPKAPVILDIAAPRSGYITAVDAEEVGNIVVALGGGRARKEAQIDHAVGVVVKTSVGKQVREGEALAEIHARTKEQAESGSVRLQTAYRIENDSFTELPLIYRIFGR
jgi:pyrimidine-nucleoside phosphorylase